MKARFVAAAAALGAGLLAASGAWAQAPAGGEAVFNTRCKSCHEPAIERAPSRTALSAYRPEQIVDALTNGVMKPMSACLSDADKQAVASFLAAGTQQQAARGRGAAGPVGVDQKCAANPPIRETGSDWTSVGLDASHRHQRNPGLTAAEAAKLKVKWAFAMPGGG